MDEKICSSCEHYVDVAYFCLSKNRFIFPESVPDECHKWEARTEKNINLNRKKIKY